MTTLSSKRLRIGADASLNAPVDALTNLTPAFYRGNDLRVEFAILAAGIPLDISNIASVTLEIRASDMDWTPPDPSTTPLMSATISSGALNNSLTSANWNAGTDQHGVITFTGTQSNIAAGPNWMSLWVVTNDSPGKVITAAAGPLTVQEDGSSGSVGTPPPPTSNYYTSVQSDARYLQQGQNLAELGSPSAARINLGLGTAAVANTGTSAGNVPVLDGSGLLSSSVIPAINVSTLATRGGVMLSGGWVNIPAFAIGKSDFDFLFLIKRESWGTEQYIFSGASGALGLRFTSGNTVRASIIGVGDTLDSGTTILTDTPTWVRLSRSSGTTTIYFNGTSVASVADTINYTGNISLIGSYDTSGTSSLIGTLFVATVWNRGVDSGSMNEYQTIGGADLSDRWGSLTNIYSTSTLTVGKRVYLKTNGTESVTINGTVYKDGTSGSTNATGGLEIVIASATVSSNTLTSASTLRYEGVLFDLDCAVGAGYQLQDRSANASHGLLSNTNWTHVVKRRDWQLIATLTAGGYIGGSGAQSVLQNGHIITALSTIGGSGITISAGETSGGTTIAGSTTCSSGVVNATLAGYTSTSGKVYVNYVSGTGSVTVFLRGVMQ